VRNVPESKKNQVYALYGITRVPYGYEVDHLVSLEVGGSNSIKNLWPEHYYDPLGARTKYRLENRLHALVCSGQLALASAQRQEAANWIAAYKKYVGPLPPGAPTSPATTTTEPMTETTTEAATNSTVPVDTTTTTTLPATSPTDPYDPNGFYASSYATASTIYCADDSAWKGLSPTYLQHFTTWAAAIYAHPGYHLHQPC
jgi:hypothetical protein